MLSKAFRITAGAAEFGAVATGLSAGITISPLLGLAVFALLTTGALYLLLLARANDSLVRHFSGPA